MYCMLWIEEASGHVYIPCYALPTLEVRFLFVVTRDNGSFSNSLESEKTRVIGGTFHWSTGECRYVCQLRHNVM
ncbi:uncharacterized protein ACN2A1_010448 isoform 2-T3 [Glossina fuscipes fuscipes]